jgi:predicted outer membrane protein
MSQERVARTVSRGRDAARVGQRCRTWSGAGAIFLAALLGSLELAGCSDYDHGYGRYDWGSPGRGGWRDGSRHGRPLPRPPVASSDAGAGVTASLDAGAVDAGLPDAGPADAGDAGTTVTSGALDAAVPAAADAGATSAVLALSDSQLLFAADAISADEIAVAQAAESAGTDPDVQAFAARLVAEHQAIRSTLQSLATSLALVPASSSVSDDLTAEDAVALQALTVPDAGAIDTPFLTEQVAALTRALTLLSQLEAAADTAPLRAELLVVQSLVQQELEDARQLSAG